MAFGSVRRFETVEEALLYLAPTNALVAQIRRDLTRSLGAIRIRIQGLSGGAEYTQMPGETLDLLADREIAVMTPEKCSLALRQNPVAFESLVSRQFLCSHPDLRADIERRRGQQRAPARPAAGAGAATGARARKRGVDPA